MTEREFEDKLRALLASWDDAEQAHFAADALIEEYLSSLGHSEVVAMLREATRWYS